MNEGMSIADSELYYILSFHYTNSYFFIFLLQCDSTFGYLAAIFSVPAKSYHVNEVTKG